MGSLTHASGVTPALHGALARHSPYTERPRRCVTCSRLAANTMEIVARYERGACLCTRCWDAGWRPA